MQQDPYGGAQSGIRVNLDFFPLAFFLFFCTPRVEIDGAVQQVPWGTHIFPVAPGAHRVRIWFEYLFLSQAGLNGADVNVAAGETVDIRFYMPPWMFAPGQLQVFSGSGQPIAVSQGAAAGWHADPTGRHQHRYWDGTQWTAAVADGGAQTSDPL